MNPKSEMALEKRVHHIMSGKLLMMNLKATLAEVAARMEAGPMSSLLIEEEGKPVGIITERDIMRALGLGLATETRAEELMSRGLIGVSSNETVHAAYHRMVLNAIRHLLVVDDDGAAVGILSETDFRKSHGVDAFVAALDVGHAMSQSYIGVTADDGLQETARKMQDHKASCALVLEDRKPVGILTERDMVRLFQAQSGALRMREAMKAPVVTVTRRQLLSDVAQQMQQKRIRRFAVVDEDGRLEGIINEHDVVRHLEDEYVQMLQKIVTEQAQALNQDKFRAVVNTVPDKIMLKDINSVYVSCNLSYAADLGIAPDEIVGKNDFDFFPPELATRYQADDRRVMGEGMPEVLEEPYVKDGVTSWVRTTKAPMRNDEGEVIGVVVVFHDITAERESLNLLHRRTWVLEVLSACDKAIISSRSEEELWREACVAATSGGSYTLACVAWRGVENDRELTLLAFAGTAQAALRGWEHSCGEDEIALNPFCRAVRQGVPQVVQDMHIDAEPWSATFREHGLSACLALPITIEGRVEGEMILFGDIANSFEPDVVRMFVELVGSIGHGVSALRQKLAYLGSLEQQRRQAVKLEQSLEGALAAIASTLEQRDPYTAGHQKHVAELALLIGKEMKLGDDALKAIYLAGIVHDIGKIQIPSEILTKPGRLIPAEFALVKSHPEVGYNILKNIAFPWPIADIVRQHHEYLDGSGYPLGLRGKDILLESRILTVADIVESMSADRPYRPALGLAKAMLEIGRLSVGKLDTGVVDACVAVIKRGDYTPSEMHLP
ncbi:MAG: CBS domain-containing protein [Sideroxydans sp.]|nr:CBS domain-containing protein [Sideroxydans sp.]